MRLKLSKIPIIDLAILAAAIAVGFAWRGAMNRDENHMFGFDYPYVDSDFGLLSFRDETTTHPVVLFLMRGWSVLQGWLPCLATLTVAITITGLRTRRRRREAWKSAGICGCIVASTFLLAGIPRACLESLQSWIADRGESGTRLFRDHFAWSEGLIPRLDRPGVRTSVALAVASSWVILAIGRRWRIGPGWQARVGFAIGLAWIGIGFVLAIAPWDFVKSP